VDSIVLARGETIWKRAAAGNVEAISTLVQKGADLDLPDGEGRTPLWHAVFCIQVETVKWILSQKPAVDVSAADEEGVTPLAVARQRERESKGGGAAADASLIAELLTQAAGTKTRLKAPMNSISE
jgi:hypothetical protein